MNSNFAYTYPWSFTNYASRIGYKAYGLLYGFAEGALRLASEKNPSIPYNAAFSGYAAHVLSSTVYKLIFDSPEFKSIDVNNQNYDLPELFNIFKPTISKEIFFKTYQNEFMNNNKFYVEFLTQYDDLFNIAFSKVKTDVGITKPFLSSKAGAGGITTKQQQDVLINYCVDSIQFPNFQSARSTMMRMGQKFEFVNNQQFEGDVTINFAFDMRSNIDRFLHYMSEKSKYYSIVQSEKFDLRITNYKPMHFDIEGYGYSITPATDVLTVGKVVSPMDLPVSSKTFKNVQLTSIQNYQLDNKNRDILSKAVGFTYLGVEENIFDGLGDSSKFLELVYDMFQNKYDW
jgi:hypothetical protein